MTAEYDNLQVAKQRYLDAEESRADAGALSDAAITEWQAAISGYESSIAGSGNLQESKQRYLDAKSAVVAALAVSDDALVEWKSAIVGYDDAIEAYAESEAVSNGPFSIWSDTATPATITETDPDAATLGLTLGVKFKTSVDGTIAGLRFYKGPQNTGTHIGKLWTATGATLATATFTNETASGWQSVLFTTPVEVTAGTTYVASYHTKGRYSSTTNYFATTGTVNGEIEAPKSTPASGNGVYRYGTPSVFPNQTWKATNYWIDVMFFWAAVTPPPPEEEIVSLWDDTATPATITENDVDAVNGLNLGVKFRVNGEEGNVVGIRFYKGPSNTGTHIGSLWSISGTLLASATFTGETASGWQEVTFSSPVPITANTTYIASYHTTGLYSSTSSYFASTNFTNGALEALSNADASGNGVYTYNAVNAVPTSTFSSTNYWVDVNFVSTGTVSPITGVQLGIGADLGGMRCFPDDNWWNLDISAAPIDPDSAAMIALLGNPTMHSDYGTFYGGTTNGFVYMVVDDNQPLLPITFYSYPTVSDPGPYPIHPDVPIKGDGLPQETYNDGHMTIIRRDLTKPNQLGELYETFLTLRPGEFNEWHAAEGGWSASNGSKWDLNSNALRPNGWTSSDAAGLPIFPANILYDDVQRAIADFALGGPGVIPHALRFTIAPGYTRQAYCHPATHHAGFGTATNMTPFGARYRLKASFDLSGLHPILQVIGRTLKKYGMFMADNGGNFWLSGSHDVRWDDNILAGISALRSNDFDVIQLGELFTYQA